MFAKMLKWLRPLRQSLEGFGVSLLNAVLWFEQLYDRALQREQKEASAHDAKSYFKSTSAHTDTQKRIIIIIWLMIAGFCLLIGFNINAAFSDKRGHINQAIKLSGARASLYDRHDQLLVSDVTDYDVFVDFSNMPAAEAPLVRRQLDGLFPELKTKIASIWKRRNDRISKILLKRWVTEDEKKILYDLGLQGLSFEGHQRRAYPLQRTGAFYIGFTERGGNGLAGAERALDQDIILKAQDKLPIRLAMDLRVQAVLDAEIRAQAEDQKALGAVGIVTNVRTGEILALTSWPEFDPGNFQKFSDDQRQNRALTNVYELGSIFKALTLAIGIDSGRATLGSTYDATVPLRIGARTIHDFHPQKRVLSLEEVFLKSSNIGTSRLLLDVGPEVARTYYERLNLLMPAKTDFLGEAMPIYPKKAWSKSDLASISFGHGLSVSALSFAGAFGSVANGGVMRPLTIKKLENAAELAGTQVFKAQTSRDILALLRENVKRGSGTRANAPGYRVGGKTGSAEKPSKGGIDRQNLISSFVAVFPTDGEVTADRYLVMIMFDSPQGSAQTDFSRLSGYVAAPVAGRVINRIAPFLGVARNEEAVIKEDWDHAAVINDDLTQTQIAPPLNQEPTASTSSNGSALKP